jgi:hypothetical protein
MRAIGSRTMGIMQSTGGRMMAIVHIPPFVAPAVVAVVDVKEGLHTRA